MLIAFSHSLSDNSCSSDLPVCLAGAPGCMGFPDLEAEGGEAAEWLLLPGDSVCLRLLPLHLHPHLSESADTLVNVWVVIQLAKHMNPLAKCFAMENEVQVVPTLRFHSFCA